MGNIACCKKPNEIIEDKDLIKKTTLRKKNNFIKEVSNTSNQEEPFIRAITKENRDININVNTNFNTNINTNNIEEENKLVDLEKKKEEQSSLGPSDNMRKKKLKNNQNNPQTSKDSVSITYNSNNNKTKNDYELTQTINTTEINKVEETKREIQLINENKNEQIIKKNTNKKINDNPNMNIINQNQDNQQINFDSPRSPMDRIRKTNDKINNINNFNEVNNNIEKQVKEPENNVSKNIKNIPQNQNINNENQVQLDKEENIIEEKSKYFVQPTNQSIEFVNNSNFIQNPSQILPKQNNIFNPNAQIKSKVQTEINNQVQEQTNVSNVAQISQTNPIDEQISYQNEQLEEAQIPQNSQRKINENDYLSKEKTINLHPQDIQEEGEDPKDSNEIYQRPNSISEDIDNNENIKENEPIKEAFIQNPDGKIYPTKQLSDSEIDILYKQCLSKGETEPDDDFNFETYKNFYPENDPFFNFDKGEVSWGQIIASPDDINNLEIYEGEINEKNNKKHGLGVSTTPLYVRKGMWREGEFTGWGRESRRNRDVLEGKFINGKINGKGILKNSKGNIYVGDFVNSKRDGYGELQTNRIHYIGQFKEDKLNGIGVIEFLVEGHKYEGEFKDNEINGKGIFRWKNGDIYEGEMSNGKMNGHGIYKYSNGQIYDGEYINGLREGKGRIIYANKVIFEGEFKGGHRIEQGNIIFSHRTNTKENNENNINLDNNEEFLQK